MNEQIDGGKLYMLVSKRKKAPLSAKDVWRYNRMRQEDIFSKPLIHMRLGFPRMRVHCDKMQEQQRGKDAIIDLNLSPSHQMLEQHRVNNVVIDLNLSPSHQMQVHKRGKDVVIDLNLSLLTCHDCGHCSETFEPFLDISLEIDQVDDLVAALESFTKVEQLGDAEHKLKCESCNGQVCKDKQLVLDATPDVVAFQLKRFTVTLDGYIEKIDKHVAYPSQLDLQLFHTNPDKEGLKYDLYGVVKHSGLPNFGHYMCTIRSSPTSWHLMNDSLVDSITETSALNQEAYLLFYVRQGMFPWFSSLLQEANSGVPSATKRMYPVNDHNVFAFENLVTEHQMNMKKQKGADLSTSSESSSLDQNASRVPTGMASVKRKCGLKRLDSPNVVLC
ncbi:hypothetical protein QYE76_051230 [Lolium multiflorum]|nr:hypothetical protein QYE76_051230 [Lolium multiflorum]